MRRMLPALLVFLFLLPSWPCLAQTCLESVLGEPGGEDNSLETLVAKRIEEGKIAPQRVPAALAGLDRLEEVRRDYQLRSLGRCMRDRYNHNFDAEERIAGDKLFLAFIIGQLVRYSDPEFQKPLTALSHMPELADLRADIKTMADSVGWMLAKRKADELVGYLSLDEVKRARRLRDSMAHLPTLAREMDVLTVAPQGLPRRGPTPVYIRQHIFRTAMVRRMAAIISLYERGLAHKRQVPAEDLADIRRDRAWLADRARENLVGFRTLAGRAQPPERRAALLAMAKLLKDALADLRRR